MRPTHAAALATLAFALSILPACAERRYQAAPHQATAQEDAGPQEDLRDLPQEDLRDLPEEPAQLCMQFSHEQGVDLGAVAPGASLSVEQHVRNCSTESALKVKRVALLPGSSPAFSLHNLPPNLGPGSVQLDPGQLLPFTLRFDPTEPGPHLGTLEILTDAEEEARLYPIQARSAGPNRCPVAVIQARSQARGPLPSQNPVQVEPLDTIELDGFLSYDPDQPGDPQAISRYEWTLEAAPMGSLTRLTPHTGGASAQLFLDLGGRYEVVLWVYDPQGQVSCEGARLVLDSASVSEDIRYEVTWDQAGLDVDAHFLHPNGRWNASPWDVYSLNPEPNWGARARSDDDPRLEVDDTDGLGPEAISLERAEAEVTYQGGVYLYQGLPEGESVRVTARLWLRGELVLEAQRRLTGRQFWTVFSLAWGAEPQIESLDTVSEGFP